MIPYNPSSFNTNKTILEQILELKNWLKEHPSYRIYISEEDFSSVQITYDLTKVYDPDSTMNVGDAVMFHNGFLCDVTSIDRDNNEFNRGSFVDMKGPQGPRGYTGNTGPEGPQGVSITNAAINSSDHLIVTLSNGSTIDAGLVVDGTKAYIIQLTSYAGTLTADDLAIVNDTSKLCVIDYYTNSKHSFYFKDRQITGGWRFSNLDYVEGSHITIIQYFEIDSATGSYAQDLTQAFIRAENINSYNATSGKVLQADGNGGASWEDAGGGSVELEIPYSQIGSALSDSDYAICQNADKMIVNYGSGDLLEYTRDSETSTEIKFARMYGNGIDTIVVNKSTKVVTNPTNKLIASDLSSGIATSGQVLKADGNGGASWQTPSGSAQLYYHAVRLYRNNYYNFYVSIVNTNSTKFTRDTFIDYIKNNFDTTGGTSKVLLATGVITGGTDRRAVGFYWTSANNQFTLQYMEQSNLSLSSSYITNINDVDIIISDVVAL